MRLKRHMDQRHAQGFADGRDGGPPDPGRVENATRYSEWAYKAGYSEGVRWRRGMLWEVARQGGPPSPPAPPPDRPDSGARFW